MPEDDYSHLIEQAEAIRKIASIYLWNEAIGQGVQTQPVWFEHYEAITQPFALTRNNIRQYGTINW